MPNSGLNADHMSYSLVVSFHLATKEEDFNDFIIENYRRAGRVHGFFKIPAVCKLRAVLSRR